MFRRAFTVGVPVAFGTTAGIVGGAYYKDELRAFASTLVETRPTSLFSGTPSSGSHVISTGFWNDSLTPVTKWNPNWDNRDPETMLNEVKYNAATEEEKKEMIAKVTPTATRHIFLIRHGQYHLDSKEKNLTELGREQAKYLGQRLATVAKNGIRFDPVFISTMTRANETATLMLEQMEPGIPSTFDSMLEEGAPYPPEPKSSHWRPKMKFYTDGSRIEAAFRKHIHRASPKQKEDSYELIVCHANVIRYFACRALQFPPEGWLRMSLAHTSITWLAVRPSGTVSIRSLGDAGHLPPNKVTFS
ncbi:histidine phosphatase superfamily (branch 1) domain-containing protein [Ditylenchus destructor]|nr:histidine phosphatase superfamily (branch 1) domain-containing protein [Ditylenchus destructor]